MQFIVSQQFFFDAAHSINYTIYPGVTGKIHGHTYHAEVSVKGPQHPVYGWVIDLMYLEERLKKIKLMLDHQYLDDIKDLGEPTLENLCRFIVTTLADLDPPVYRVRVWRTASGNSCELIMGV